MSAAPTGISPLFDFAFALPEHLLLGAGAASGLRGLPQRQDVENIVIFGMGTGKTAGHVMRAVGATTIPVPMLVESAYEIPACVGKGSLVFAVSGSGNTDEVNHAAAASAMRGARLAVITTGGWLADFAQDHGAPLVQIPPNIQPARVTFGVVIASLLTMIESVGFLPEARLWLDGAVAQLSRRREELRWEGNAAERLATLLVGRHVLCQGDTPIGAAAAERWKAQINQNARQAASASEQPNASHNEAVAWDCRNDLTLKRDAAVLLRHGFEDARVSQRMDRLAQYLSGKVPVHSVRGEGDTPFAVLMDLAMIGDCTSLHLAELNGVDPSSAQFISHTVKQGLAPPKR
ncbi:SIS domain-containing protein [Methyloceanibacter sp.]|uniref:SIS domain-containing protein n=1 Tax=Methyloceanibacter sp. TaxID=1965321 RepID=UPI003D6D9C46